MWGYFGKVPNRGDFISHQLAPAIRDLFFEWCQAGLAVSREQLGENWLDAYLTAPIWHFAASPDTLSESGLVGTFIPSVDRVGRHFPFMVIGQYPGRALDAWRDPQWAGQLEEKVLAVLDDHWDEAAWQQGLGEIKPPAPTPGRLRLPNEEGNLVLPGEVSERQLLAALLNKEEEKTLWWTQGSAYVEPCWLSTRGLPQVGQFAALLAGQWQEQGWQTATLMEQ